jgi:hypothetical protein
VGPADGRRCGDRHDLVGDGLGVPDIEPAGAAVFLPSAFEVEGAKQARVRGRIGAAEFTSNVMPAGGGRLALSVSKAMMTAAGIGIGDQADIEISGVGRD